MGRHHAGRGWATTMMVVALVAGVVAGAAGQARGAVDGEAAAEAAAPAGSEHGRPPTATAPSPAAPGAPVVAAVAVAPVGGRVLRRFDPPATPFGRGHRGVDLAAAPGEIVRSALAGTVTFSGPVAGISWVTVSHGDGLTTTYGGLRPHVRTGDHVALGQALGRATRRGWIDWGARRDGVYIDPLGLLRGWRVRLVPVD